MRSLSVIGLVLVSVLLSGAAYSANYAVSIDENGNGWFNGTSVMGQLGQDPVSGMTTLVYDFGNFLPPFASVGDLNIYEDPTQGTLSDVVRFLPGGHIAFFSDIEPGEPNQDLADVGLPPRPFGEQAFGVEVGPSDDNNWFDYTPAVGTDPGWLGPNDTVSYHIISDVPEPSTMVPMLCGLGALGGFFWKRRR